MPKNRFQIIFTNGKEQVPVDYTLDDSALADKWFKKIKWISRVPYDPIESDTVDVSDLAGIYKEFCKFSNLDPIDIGTMDQPVLNKLHKIYEEEHERLSKMPNNAVLYKFHHSIHHNEDKPTSTNDAIHVGWGVREGPLTEQFTCHTFYADSILRNQLYLHWSELGKKPLEYWRDKEPNNQQRFNQLSKPHITFRPKFFVALNDITPQQFDPEFTEWFSTYKKQWCAAHNIEDYTEKHHYSAPILAHTEYKGNLDGFRYERILYYDSNKRRPGI